MDTELKEMYMDIPKGCRAVFAYNEKELSLMELPSDTPSRLKKYDLLQCRALREWMKRKKTEGGK